MQSFDSAEDYGCSKYRGIIADRRWIENVATSRKVIEENLMINDEGTLNIMKEWRTYENSRFSVLNKKKTLILQPRDFSKKLDEMIAEIRSDLRTEWVKEVSIIFNKEADKLKKKKELSYYNSVSTLMNIQLRNLITASLQDYRHYFQKFKKKEYPSPKFVIESEKNWHNPINEVFLEIKLRENEEG